MRKEKKIRVTEGSSEWAYHQSEHRNVRARLIIARFTFLQSLAHMYNMDQSVEQCIVFCCTLCDCELSNSKTSSVRVQHICFPQLFSYCVNDFSGLLSGGDAESMLKASKGSRHVSYMCTWPNYPKYGLSLLRLHIIITEPLMISINYSYYRYPQLHTKMCTRNACALVQVMLRVLHLTTISLCRNEQQGGAT